MKVYILIEQVFTTTEEPYSEILGVYKNKYDAEKEKNKTIKENVENFNFVEDEQDNILQNHTIIFYQYQENWDNYIEYKIIKKEIK